MATNAFIRAQQVAKRIRQKKIEDCMLHGHCDHEELAVRFGVDYATINNDVKAIRLRWTELDIKESNNRRNEAIRRLLFAAQTAILAFERSQQNEEEIQTQYEKKPCPDCVDHPGWADKNETEWCSNCDGEKEIVVEKITKKVRGKAGDSSFLRVYTDCVKEIAKIGGVYPTISTHVKIGGNDINVVQVPKLDLTGTSPEALLEVKKAIALLMAPKQAETMVIDTTTVDNDGRESK